MRLRLVCMVLAVLAIPICLQQPDSGNLTIIDRTVMAKSVPPVMRMGRSYSVRILVKNDALNPKRLRIVIHTPGKFIYPDYDSEIFVIGAKNVYQTTFRLTPIRPHIGSVNVTAYLIEGQSPEFLPTDYRLVDTVTCQVGRIDPLLSGRQRAFLSVVLILVIALVVFAIYRRLGRVPSPIS